MPAKIIDQFTDLHVSREMKRCLRLQAKGICSVSKCGAPLSKFSKWHCNHHMQITRERLHLERGYVDRFFNAKSYKLGGQV